MPSDYGKVIKVNINSINVNKYPISQILDPDSKLIFEVPKYQREYVWGTKQWEELFDDLMENDNGYFLGSIICINTTQDAINNPKFEVVDGQQRLTTISLFLAALYTTLNSHREELDEDQQADILQLKRKLVLKKTNSDIRIIPQVQNSNLDDYLGLLADKKIIAPHKWPKFAGLRRIVKAYNYFAKRIEDILAEAKEPVSAMFEVLDKVNTAILVMIEVSNHSDAYTLFESLNDRGTPLTVIDLIKNTLLARLDLKEKDNLDYYFTRWTEVLDNLSDNYSVQERFFRQNYNAFRAMINKPFVVDERPYPLGIVATRSTMLDIYERVVVKDPKQFLEEISENSEIYSQIILQKTDGLSPELKNRYLSLQRIQGVPSYLLLLYLVKNGESLKVEEKELLQINDLLIKFFVRRNLTDTPPTRDMTRLFMAFIEEIEREKYIGKEIYDHLRNKLIACTADDELFEAKLRGPVYEDNIGATRYILCSIAKKGMTAESQIDLWRTSNSHVFVWTIEHIFPQGKNIPDSWVKMIANGDLATAKEYQEQYVHTFGNLTITGYNSTLGNKSFEEKKERKDNNGNYIGYRNGLNLNADVVDKKIWSIAVIQERTDSLVKQILEMFKL